VPLIDHNDVDDRAIELPGLVGAVRRIGAPGPRYRGRPLLALQRSLNAGSAI
jgi:hypothetical protein